MSSATTVTSKKRKRTKNTSNEQYELYIQQMENDYVFRSGTINPTVDDNYIENKWQELTNLLNSVGDGPRLTEDEWKKRFSDWKYATRTKFRKLSEHRKKTGSGPQATISMTPLEERGLAVWGKVVVTGSPFINEYDGIERTVQHEERIECEKTDQANIIFEVEDTNIALDESFTIVNTDASLADNSSVQTNNMPKSVLLANGGRGHRPRPKPLNVLAETLITNSENCEKNNKELNGIIQTFCENYINIKTEKVQLEIKKMQFEITKYKFENPTFQFNQ